MSVASRRSVEDIRRETEATRAGLTRTVDELRDAVGDTTADIKAKLRPEAIKADVTNYLRGKSETLLRDVGEAAQRNPVQALAIGASLAFPLLRIARAIPLPVLMIGAGLFLTNTQKGKELARQASKTADDAMSEVVRRVHDARDGLSEALAEAKTTATDAVSSLKDMAQDLQQRAGDVAANAALFARSSSEAVVETTVEKAGASKRAASEALQSVTGRAQDSLAEAANKATHSITSSKDASGDFIGSARERLSDGGERAGRTVREAVEQNPLIVAGVGLFLGGLLASAFPRSETEDKLVGQASERVKAKAKTTASRGIDAIKGSAADVLDRVTEQARAEGLTAENLQQGLRDVGDKVKAVAERAATVALSSSNANAPSSKDATTKNGEHHG